MLISSSEFSRIPKNWLSFLRVAKQFSDGYFKVILTYFLCFSYKNMFKCYNLSKESDIISNKQLIWLAYSMFILSYRTAAKFCSPAVKKSSRVGNIVNIHVLYNGNLLVKLQLLNAVAGWCTLTATPAHARLTYARSWSDHVTALQPMAGLGSARPAASAPRGHRGWRTHAYCLLSVETVSWSWTKKRIDFLYIMALIGKVLVLLVCRWFRFAQLAKGKKSRP